jgi:hypothetical protein
MTEAEMSYPGVTFRLGRPKATTKNGTSYVTMINGAIVPEGEHPPTTPITLGAEQEAERSAQLQFDRGLAEYLRSECAKVVEWRVPPTVEWYKDGYSFTTDDLPDRVYVRARLAVVKRYTA